MKFKDLLLQKHWTNFTETWQETSLGEDLNSFIIITLCKRVYWLELFLRWAMWPMSILSFRPLYNIQYRSVWVLLLLYRSRYVACFWVGDTSVLQNLHCLWWGNESTLFKIIILVSYIITFLLFQILTSDTCKKVQNFETCSTGYAYIML